MAQEYIYAVTRIHSQEKDLLSAQDLERLSGADSVEECLRLLSEKGWGAPELPAGDIDALLAYERDKAYALVREELEDLTPLNTLLRGNDFHNLKAAIKLVYTDQDEGETGRYFLEPATVEPKTLLTAVRQHDFSLLPPDMAQAGAEAYEILVHTENGQACDMAIDRAALLAIDAEAKRSGIELMERYARHRADTANIRAAVRACHMGKGRDFLTRAIAPVGSLDTKRLIEAAEKSFDEICTYLQNTSYSDAVEALRESLAAFERWCDDRLMEEIRPQKNEYFSIEPMAAYILARENEIAMVRLILSAKVNRFSDAALRARWRQMYV